jgi:hypothetical protein
MLEVGLLSPFYPPKVMWLLKLPLDLGSSLFNFDPMVILKTLHLWGDKRETKALLLALLLENIGKEND